MADATVTYEPVDSYEASTIQKESSGNPQAHNPQPGSTSSGLYGITDPTMSDVLKHHPDLPNDKNNSQVFQALRQDNANVFRAKYGRDPTPDEEYNMHHYGPHSDKVVTQPASVTYEDAPDSQPGAAQVSYEDAGPKRRFEDLANDDQLINSVRDYAKRFYPDEEQQFRTKGDVVDWFVNNRRWVDSNDLSMIKENMHTQALTPQGRQNLQDMARALGAGWDDTQVPGGKDPEADKQTLHSLGYMRKAWSELPDFWQQGGQGAGALAGDIARSLPSAGTAISMVTGPLGKLMGFIPALATQAGVQGAISGGLNLENQKTDVAVGNRDDVNYGEAAAAGATGAALSLLPGTFFGKSPITAEAIESAKDAATRKALIAAASEATGKSPEEITAALEARSAVAMPGAKVSPITKPLIDMGSEEATTRPEAIENQILAKSNISDDAKALVGQMREDQSDSYMNFKRQTVTNAEAIAKASEYVAQDPAKALAETRAIKPGTAVNVDQMAVAYVLREQARRRLGMILEGADTTTPEQAERYALSVQQASDDFLHLDIIADSRASEAARATQFARNLVPDVTNPENRLAALQTAMKRITGSPDIKPIIPFMKQLIDDPDRLSYFLKRMEDIKNTPTTWDKVSEVYYNSLLTGISTHVALFKGNLAAQVMELPVTALAAGIGKVRQAFSGTEDRVFAGEAAARLYGLGTGFLHGLSVAGQTFKDAYSGAQQSFADVAHPPAIGGLAGKAFRTPMTIISAVENFFKAWDNKATTYQYAYREAQKAGGPSLNIVRAVSDYVSDVENNPELAAKIEEHGKYMAFQNKPNAVAQWMIDARNKFPPLTFIIPFIRTPANILDMGLEYTPIGSLYGRSRTALEAGGADRDMALAKLGIGAATMTYFGMKAHNGEITGAEPLDHIDKERGQLVRIPPYSIKMGDTWYSYQRADPYALPLQMAADVGNYYKNLNGHEDQKSLNNFLYSLGHQMTDHSYLQGLTNIVEAMESPDKKAETFLGGLAGSFVPTIVAHTANMEDPYKRELSGIGSRVQNRIPDNFLGVPLKEMGVPTKSELPLKYDAAGRPIHVEPPVGADTLGENVARMVSPFQKQKQDDDAVTNEMARLGVGIGTLPKNFEGIKLTPEQHSDAQHRIGQAFYRNMDILMQSPQWTKVPDVVRQAAAAKAHEEAGKEELVHLLQTDENFKKDYGTKLLQRLDPKNPMSRQMEDLLGK